MLWMLYGEIAHVQTVVHSYCSGIPDESGGGFFLAVSFLGKVRPFIPCLHFFFLGESLRTLIPLFSPELVHSGLVS